MAEQLARHEDTVDRVREVLEDLRADLADEQPLDGFELLERLEAALEVEEST